MQELQDLDNQIAQSQEELSTINDDINDLINQINENEDNEIECPECHNIIELDLNGDIEDEIGNNAECFGNCPSCGGCGFKQQHNSDDDDEDI